MGTTGSDSVGQQSGIGDTFIEFQVNFCFFPSVLCCFCLVPRGFSSPRSVYRFVHMYLMYFFLARNKSTTWNSIGILVENMSPFLLGILKPSEQITGTNWKFPRNYQMKSVSEHHCFLRKTGFGIFLASVFLTPFLFWPNLYHIYKYICIYFARIWLQAISQRNQLLKQNNVQAKEKEKTKLCTVHRICIVPFIH